MKKEEKIYNALLAAAVATAFALAALLVYADATAEARYAAARAEGAAQCDREVEAADGEAAWIDNRLAKGDSHD